MAKDKVSKMEAVRQTLVTLGGNPKPLAIQEHLRNNFSIEMTTNMISNYKTVLAKRGKRKSKRGRKPGSVAIAVAAAPAERRGSISMADIQAVKALTDRIGVERVRELASVLAK